MTKRSFLRVLHKATGQTALGIRHPDGCVLVQIDLFSHPQSHGWHLYPRHHFRRYRRPESWAPLRVTQPFINRDLFLISGHEVTAEELQDATPAGVAVAETLRDAWRRANPQIARWPADEPLPPFIVGNQAGYYP